MNPAFVLVYSLGDEMYKWARASSLQIGTNEAEVMACLVCRVSSAIDRVRRQERVEAVTPQLYEQDRPSEMCGRSFPTLVGMSAARGTWLPFFDIVPGRKQGLMQPKVLANPPTTWLRGFELKLLTRV